MGECNQAAKLLALSGSQGVCYGAAVGGFPPTKGCWWWPAGLFDSFQPIFLSYPVAKTASARFGLGQNKLQLVEASTCAPMPKPPLRRFDALEQGVRGERVALSQTAQALQDMFEPHCDVKPIQDALDRSPREVGRVGPVFATVADDRHRRV